MRKLKYDSICACGSTVQLEIERPTQKQNTVAKSTCQRCKATFVFTCSVPKKKVDMSFLTSMEM